MPPSRSVAAARALALACCALAVQFWGPRAHAQATSAAPPAAQNAHALPRARSLTALLERCAQDRSPIVAMFSRAGCPYCAAIRRDQLAHLVRDAAARGVQVVEFDIADERAFVAGASPSGSTGLRSESGASDPSRPDRADVLRAAASPAALARALRIRLAPTVVFLGPDGELAKRLIGYSSPDFYGAYLDERIEQARAALAPK